MNIANMTTQQQEQIEIDKLASYLIWQLRQCKTSRYDVKQRIEASNDKEALRSALNKFNRG